MSLPSVVVVVRVVLVAVVVVLVVEVGVVVVDVTCSRLSVVALVSATCTADDVTKAVGKPPVWLP